MKIRTMLLITFAFTAIFAGFVIFSANRATNAHSQFIPFEMKLDSSKINNGKKSYYYSPIEKDSNKYVSLDNDTNHLVKASYVDSLVKAGKLKDFSGFFNASGERIDALPAKIKRAHKVIKDTLPMIDRGACVTSYAGIMFEGPNGRETLVPAKSKSEVDSLAEAFTKAWGIDHTMPISEIISKIKKHKDLLETEMSIDSLILAKMDSIPNPSADIQAYEEFLKREGIQIEK